MRNVASGFSCTRCQRWYAVLPVGCAFRNGELLRKQPSSMFAQVAATNAGSRRILGRIHGWELSACASQHDEHATLSRFTSRPPLAPAKLTRMCAGEGIKTIVPATASVKIAARLVPTQKPDAVLKAITKHVEKRSSPHAHVTIKQLGWFAQPFFMERDTLVNKAAAKVHAEQFARPLLLLLR